MFRTHPAKGKRILEPIPSMRELIAGLLVPPRVLGRRGLSARPARPTTSRSSGASSPIADAYDAMTSDRAYRKALPHEVAIAEIERCAGAQFDPELVPMFIRRSRSSGSWKRPPDGRFPGRADQARTGQARTGPSQDRTKPGPDQARTSDLPGARRSGTGPRCAFGALSAIVPRMSKTGFSMVLAVAFFVATAGARAQTPSAVPSAPPKAIGAPAPTPAAAGAGTPHPTGTGAPRPRAPAAASSPARPLGTRPLLPPGASPTAAAPPRSRDPSHRPSSSS